MRAKFIFEKFTEDSDPIHDLGIGIIKQIEIYVEKQDISDYCFSYDIKKEFDPKDPNYALVICAKDEQELYTNYLLDSTNADVNFDFSIAFRWACQWGNIKILRKFIAKGADLNVHSRSDSPLACALYRNKLKAAKLLVSKGAKLNDEALMYSTHVKPEMSKEKIKKYLLGSKTKEINEKFVEDSDPIQDLGICIKNKNFTSGDEFYTFLFNLLPHILQKEKVPHDFIEKYGPIIKEKYYIIICHFFVENNIKFNNVPVNDWKSNVYYWPSELRKMLINKGFKPL